MALKLKVNEKSGIVKVIGRVDSTTANDFDSALKTVTRAGKAPIVEMSRTGFFSSAGLRALLAAQERLKPKRKVIALLNMPDKIKKAFELSGFLDMFDVVD